MPTHLSSTVGLYHGHNTKQKVKLLYSVENAETYSFCKDAIFSRYRTLSETLESY